MGESPLPDEQLDNIIDQALAEDVSHGDITSDVLMPAGMNGRASILIKEEGILAGIEIAARVFRRVDPSLEIELLIKDGAQVIAGDIAATVAGGMASILKAERTALNFLQRLCGIASLTARYASETEGTKASIFDTRKTTPGLRSLEKYAVRVGCGKNHRLHLGDGILIKDNHLVAMRATGMSLNDIVAKARRNAPQETRVEVEVTSVKEALEVVAAGADIVMLDNMGLEEMRRAADAIAGRARIEASGGITLENVREVAMTGVDIISIGALTHSPKALDISLELESDAPD